MAIYECPRCGGTATRDAANTGHKFGGGIAGVMLSAAFAGFTCGKCGAIPRSEFPPEIRSQMTTRTVLMVVGAVAIIGAAIALIVAINS